MRVPKCRSAHCQTRSKTEPRLPALIWRVDLAEASHCGGDAQANSHQRRLLSPAPTGLPIGGAGAPCTHPFPAGLSFPQLARDDLGKTTNAAAKAIAGKIRKVTFTI